MATQKTPIKKTSPKQGPVQVIVKPPIRKASDVAAWRTALQSADMGRMKLLFDLYEDLLIDGVLSDAVDKRINAVNNSPITFQDASGKDVPELTDIIDTPAFEELLSTIMHSRFWGRAAGEFDFSEGFGFNPLPFKHINLNNKNILINENDDKGVDYSVDDQILVLGRPGAFGLFLKTAPFAIWKRGGFGDYAQWLELFGMPQRIGKYSSYDPESRQTLVAAMEQAGSAPWLVIPKETEVETVNNTGTGSSSGAHNDFRKACNEEILISILGQTMTTLDGSSKSQSETHKAVEEGKNRADMRFVRRVLNRQVLPLLEKRGFPVKGGKFVFPESAKELAVSDIKILSELIEIPANYLHDKYSIPVPENGEQIARASASAPAIPPVNDPVVIPAKPPKEKIKLIDDDGAMELRDQTNFWKGLASFFGSASGSGANLILSDEKKVTKVVDIDKLFKQALKNIFAAEGIIENAAEIDEKIFELTNAVLQHASGSTFLKAGIDWGKKNELFIQQFSENTAVFSAFKSHEQSGKIVGLLTNEDGSLKSFSAFKKETLKISEEYNKQYLQTEYNTAVRSARMAVNWKKFQETKRLYPNLEYMPSRAANPRESHTELYHLIFPIDDPFWNTNLPPSDWNCLCGVRQTDESATILPDDWKQPEVDPVFDNNAGETGQFINIEATNYYLNAAETKRAEIEDFAREMLKQYD